ncbi:MAG: hypothetical protein IE931_11115 [Sphingobacteriales bacterium]|nr:hypothetical protein [Sphingobacteriales bacterium]
MNKQQILKKIGSIIQELKEQHEYLAHVDAINDLELELFAANVDFLNDHIAILKRLNEVKTKLEVEEKIEDLKDANLVEEPMVKEIPESTAPEKKSFFSFSFDEEPEEMVFDFEKKIAVEEVFDRALSEEEKVLIEEKKTKEQTIEVEEVKSDEKVEEEVIAEEIMETPLVEEVEEIPKPKADETVSNHGEEKRLTLNEMLSSKLGGRANSPAPKSIGDLKSAISLNDKMIFIKELFNGYNLAYSEALEIINRFDSFEAANHFLQKNYAQKNDWESKQTTVDRFYAYLHRKFVM